MPNKLTVVIPVLNGAETLSGVLDALFSQSAEFEYEVVIVDSGSRDGSLELVKRHPIQLIEISPSEFNHGETRNCGIRYGDGEIAVLLTQDATPASSNFLAEIAKPFEDPEVAGVFGRQIPRSDCDVVSERNLRGWVAGGDQAARSKLGDRCLESLNPMERYRLCVFDNVCSAVRRTAWEEVPFPSSRFGEDIAWGKSAISRGWTLAFTPGAAVFHSHRRPIAYEYGRTRICHETLHRLFGLETVPSLRDGFRSVAYNLRTDIPYVWQNAPEGFERFKQLARIAGLSVASPLAQYQGIQDAKRAAQS